MAGGRPSAYKPEYAEQAAKLCALGATDAEMADFFEVSTQTIGNWKSRYPEFLEALKESKAAFDARVERKLFERAMGYTYDAVKIFQYQGQVIEAPYREHVAPDTTACIFWLKNRQPERWRDRMDLNHSGSIRAVDDEQLDARISILLGKARTTGDSGGKGSSKKDE